MLIEINNLTHVIFFSPLVLHLWLLYFELKINKHFRKRNVFCMLLGALILRQKIEDAFTFIKKKKRKEQNGTKKT